MEFTKLWGQRRGSAQLGCGATSEFMAARPLGVAIEVQNVDMIR